MITKRDPSRKDTSFLKTQVKLLQMALMWPLERGGFLKRLSAHLYFYLIVFSVSLCSVGLLLMSMAAGDLVGRSEAIDMLTLTSSALFKILYFNFNHDRMRALADYADNLFLKNDPYDGGNLRMDEWMRLVPKIAIAYAFSGFFVLSFWCVCPIFSVVFGVTPLKDMAQPVNVWYPFDYKSTIKFTVFYLIHYFGVLCSAQCYLACDGFFFSLIYLSTGQISILKASLKKIEYVKPEGNESEEDAKHNALKKCIQHHNIIKIFLKELDMVFRSMILVDILHAIISLSFAMFQTSETKGVLETMKMVLFISICILHQYLNSLFGQILINKQNSLMDAVYDVDWTDRSNNFKKTMQIMMTGSLTPIRFSAWRMYFLQYATFVEFCRTMVSFFMFLRTLGV